MGVGRLQSDGLSMERPRAADRRVGGGAYRMKGAGTVQKLNEEEARQWLEANLPTWAVREGELYRQYRTANWRVTLMAANAIGFAAEAANHHPRLILNYRSVEVFLSTHDANGLTAKDFELARRIEETMRWPGEDVETFDRRPKYWLRD